MSTTPADPPLPSPDPAAEITAAGAALPRRRGLAPPSRGDKAAPLSTAWTTSREVCLECGACGAAFVLSYKYRFVEGLSATVIRCPGAGCKQGREYYLPVNAFDVLVAQAAAPKHSA